MRPICEISRAVKAIRDKQDRGMREIGKRRREEKGDGRAMSSSM